MPLQNRVNPQGNIVIDASRGKLMGNRGILHNEHRQVHKTHAHPNWVSCALQHKGIKRQLMAPNRYTELFFLDEFTALAAGHRPCSSCRKEAFTKFKLAWFSASQDLVGGGFKASEMDKIIHKDRIHRGKKVTYQEKLNSLPEGAMIMIKDQPHLILGGKIYQWSFNGYKRTDLQITDEVVEVLTPKSIVAAISAGYKPTALAL